MRKLAKSKTGGESSETGLISVGLLVIAAIVILVFAMIASSIFHLLTKTESQSTANSFNLFVSKIKALDTGSISETAHAYYLQDGFYLFGFNAHPMEVSHTGGDGNDVRIEKKQAMCGSGEACLCICDSMKCDGNIIDCNKAADGKVEFDNIERFVVVDDNENRINQGNKVPTGEGNYVAFFGKWGKGIDLGPLEAAVHHWPNGAVIYLKRLGNPEGYTIEVYVNGKPG